jgi:putative drug exporter of the RND superfamily
MHLHLLYQLAAGTKRRATAARRPDSAACARNTTVPAQPTPRSSRGRTHRAPGHQRRAFLLLAFASLASAPDTDIKVLATGLGIGILLDATLIRALLLPALVSLLGRSNWSFPRPVARVLRVSRPPRLAIETAEQ